MRRQIKRIFSEKTVWIGIAAVLIGILAGNIASDGNMKDWSQKSIWQIVSDGFSSRIMLFLLPVAASFSGADFYLREKQSGFLKMYVTREGRKRYRRERISQILYHTGVIFTAAFVMAAGLRIAAGKKMILAVVPDGPVQEGFAVCGIWLRAALISAVFANLGAICAVLTQSLYLTMGIPLVCYYFLILLQERYFEQFPWLSPGMWITENSWIGWLIVLILFGTVTGIHAKLLKRDLREIS
ncbi:MAG: hypothetical protein Q4B90_07300 [Eubacteriales bacterium]|nr:hypothetical protein [Eubacteriales bacterium]